MSHPLLLRSRLIPGTLLLILSISTGVAAEPESVRAPLLFSSGMESGSLVSGQGWRVSGNAPTVTTAVAREGKYALRSYLNRARSEISYRTEVRAMAPMPELGQEYWYGFSIYVPAPFVPDNVWELVAQWHSVPDPEDDQSGLNPPIGLSFDGDNYKFVNRYSTASTTTQDNRVIGISTSLGPVEPGKWTDWVLNVKWSATEGQGFLRLWKNGKLVVDAKGPNTYRDATGPYFKMGIYKGWKDRTDPPGVVSERVVYHDSFRMAGAGGSYADVAPGGSVAQPGPPEELTVH